MVVGLLGLQGAFRDHIPHLNRCGAAHRVVRTATDLDGIDRLIIPGGESTVMAKFINEFGLSAPLRRRIGAGMQVWGICAGAIILAEVVDDGPGPLGLVPMSVKRNAYGRQVASDTRLIDIAVLDAKAYPAIFIRSPRIVSIADCVTIHAERDEDPVFVQKGRIMATTFHPELNPDDSFHRYFLSL